MLKNALIVDDSRLARLTLKRLLEKYDIAVYEAEGVLDAERWISTNVVPDLVFMDVMMPELDGFEGLARLRAEPETKHVPVIMYSGDISEEARKKARENGATGYLPKPADVNRLDHLLNALNKHLKNATQTAVSPEGVSAVGNQELEQSLSEEVPSVRQSTVTAEMKRRLEEVERRLSSQDVNKNALEANADLERHRRDVVYLQRQIAKSEHQVKIALGVGVVALLIALAAVIRQLL